MTVFLRTLFFVSLGLAAWQAHADVYGFVDEQGEVHLADKPLDARYRLFKRGALPAASSSAAAAELGRYLDARDQAALKRLDLGEEEKRRVELHEPIVIETPAPVEVPVSKKAEKRIEREKQVALFPEAILGGTLPPLHLLDPAPPATETVSPETLEYTSRLIERKLADFGVEVKVLRMQGAKDPDEFLKKYGADRFSLLLDQSENQA